MTVSTTSKYTLRFTASQSNSEYVTRSISGLNFPSVGPSRDGAISNLIGKLGLFTGSTLSNFRLVTEQEVIS